MGQWFSPGPAVSSTIKIDCHNITEILLKVVLSTKKPKPFWPSDLNKVIYVYLYKNGNPNLLIFSKSKVKSAH